MNCLECQELLQQKLDGAATAPSSEFDAHLGSCMKCRELHAGAQRLLDVIQKQVPPKLPVDFAKRTAAMVLGDRRERRRKVRSRLFITAALAASVIVMVLFAYAMLPRSPMPKGNDGLAKQDAIKIEEKKKETPPTKSVEKQPERPSAIAALPTRWVDATRDHAKVVLAAANFDSVASLPIDPTATEAAQEMSDGVRTVTLNTRKAFDFFAREFPMPDLGERRD
ncbi:MAG: hypothetical protein EXS16_06905 [Gemmataceae bacterium]|nr:hypothetical protein [Gemmataceae bacterium]